VQEEHRNKLFHIAGLAGKTGEGGGKAETRIRGAFPQYAAATLEAQAESGNKLIILVELQNSSHPPFSDS
jgi:hypothetical protein